MSSHSASDSGMYKMMLVVLGAICLLTLFIIMTARSLSSGSNDEFDPLMHNAMMERIAPAGQVRTEAEPVAMVQTAVAAAPRSGEELANGACASCHISGAAGAPKFDDTAEWQARAAGGLEALVKSVIEGKGGMPARGASDYSDEEITRAVEYMTGLGNGGEVSAAEPAAPAADDATTETAEAAEAADAAESEAAVAAEPAATTETAATDAADSAQPAAEGVIAALTPRIQQTVDTGVCAGCHKNGVLEAPKYGDKAAWEERAEAGYAAMAQSVKMGKGNMPSRGGSDLTDDELLIAVEYVVKKGS